MSLTGPNHSEKNIWQVFTTFSFLSYLVHLYRPPFRFLCQCLVMFVTMLSTSCLFVVCEPVDSFAVGEHDALGSPPHENVSFILFFFSSSSFSSSSSYGERHSTNIGRVLWCCDGVIWCTVNASKCVFSNSFIFVLRFVCLFIYFSSGNYPPAGITSYGEFPTF